jgi:hypothetical protein
MTLSATLRLAVSECGITSTVEADSTGSRNAIGALFSAVSRMSCFLPIRASIPI